MKKIVLFLLSFLNVTIISAQEQCLTASPEPPQWIFNKSARSILTSTSYSLNIFVHIVRSSSGQGLGTGILSTIENSLNSNFGAADIHFSLLGSEFIDNDYYYVNFSGKENQLLGLNSHCEAIDIYVLGESTSWSAAGMAQNIPSTALIIHGGYYVTSSLPHEMGHCLGLYHTHHGTVSEAGGDINQCPELVDGSNSVVCGDYISDTPADPNQWSINSCTYTGTGTDANGDPYSPDVSNLMSYAYKPCRDLFSELQIGRMKDFIDNTTILQNVFHSTISGPSIVCSSAMFTVNNQPPGTTVSWDESANLTEDPQNPGTFTANGSGDGWVRATLTNDCGEITLPRKTVEVGKPERPEVSGSATLDCRELMYYEEYRRIVSWSVFGPLEIVGSNYGYKCRIRGTNTGNSYQEGWIYVTDENDCGSIRGELRVEVFCSLHYLVLSPNPATGETTLIIESDSEEKSEFDIEAEWELEVYNNTQMLKEKKTKLKGNEYKLNTSNWKEGVYMVRIKYKDEILTGKLVVTR